MSYHSGPGITAIVEFLTLDKWKEEIDYLLSDVQDDRKKALSDSTSVGGVAWQKVNLDARVIMKEKDVLTVSDPCCLSQHQILGLGGNVCG